MHKKLLVFVGLILLALALLASIYPPQFYTSKFVFENPEHSFEGYMHLPLAVFNEGSEQDHVQIIFLARDKWDIFPHTKLSETTYSIFLVFDKDSQLSEAYLSIRGDTALMEFVELEGTVEWTDGFIKNLHLESTDGGKSSFVAFLKSAILTEEEWDIRENLERLFIESKELQ